tara:strand:- start:219 stop:341 length:123 start_codon:yes stop_codon:yes gene_type:complete
MAKTSLQPTLSKQKPMKNLSELQNKRTEEELDLKEQIYNA